jgi:hypothetical protein
VFDYEILILCENGAPRAYVAMRTGNDDCVMRSALDIANGRPFEVWRDSVCVHRSVSTLIPEGQPNSRWRGLGALHQK